jgi:ABC1 atypical kinase-like domain
LQVHAAKLKGGGKDVVLKVLKPGVEATLLTDLNFLYLAGKLLQIISPELERTSLVGIIEDIRTSMLDEVRTRPSSSGNCLWRHDPQNRRDRCFCRSPTHTICSENEASNTFLSMFLL